MFRILLQQVRRDRLTLPIWILGTALLLTPVQETTQANPECKGTFEIAAGWLRQGNTPLVGVPQRQLVRLSFRVSAYANPTRVSCRADRLTA